MYFVAAYPMLSAAIASTAASAAGAAVSAHQSHVAGEAAAAQATEQATVDKEKMNGDELNRRRSLITALATQNAAAGANGITTDGSLGGSMRYQISQEQQDMMTLQAGGSAQQELLADQAANARVSGNAGAAASILDGLGKAASSGVNDYKTYGGT